MVGHGGIVAFDDDHRHARRRPPPAALRRRRELRQVLPVPDRPAPRPRDVRRRRRRSTARCLEDAAGDARARLACAPTAAACRRRSAACSPTSPRSWGSHDRASRSTARAVEVEPGTTILDAARAAGELGPDALLRRAPGPVRRLPRLPGRPSRAAEAAARLHDAAAATGWWSTPRDATARRVAGARRRAGAVRAARAAGRRTPSWPRWPRELGGRRAALARARRTRVATTTRHPYLALRHELCISCGRCVRACDEVQGTFALTATGRGFDANIAAGLDAGLPRTRPASPAAPAPTPARPTRSPRSACSLGDIAR